MTKKNNEKKLVRMLQEVLGVTYMQALNALRSVGGDYKLAYEKLTKREKDG